MIVLYAIVVIIGWLAFAAGAFAAMDAIFGQPVLGKWWRRK